MKKLTKGLAALAVSGALLSSLPGCTTDGRTGAMTGGGALVGNIIGNATMNPVAGFIIGGLLGLTVDQVDKEREPQPYAVPGPEYIK